MTDLLKTTTTTYYLSKGQVEVSKGGGVVLWLNGNSIALSQKDFREFVSNLQSVMLDIQK